jgi:Peptidase family M50.
MAIAIKILQFIMALSILIVIHEFGHFITAKIFKVKVEKFYCFLISGDSIFSSSTLEAPNMEWDGVLWEVM